MKNEEMKLPKTFLFPNDWSLTMVSLFVLALSVVLCFVSSAIGEIVMKIPMLRFVMFGVK